MIDESSFIDSNRNMVIKKVFRFAVEANGIVLIISVTNDGNYSISSQIDKSSIDVACQKLDLIRFFNSKVVLSANGLPNQTCVFIYDIGRSCFKLLLQLIFNFSFFLRIKILHET